jgi:hypothetical protein
MHDLGVEVRLVTARYCVLFALLSVLCCLLSFTLFCNLLCLLSVLCCLMLFSFCSLCCVFLFALFINTCCYCCHCDDTIVFIVIFISFLLDTLHSTRAFKLELSLWHLLQSWAVPLDITAHNKYLRCLLQMGLAQVRGCYCHLVLRVCFTFV